MIESEWLDKYEALEDLEGVEESDLNDLGISLNTLVKEIQKGWDYDD